jgi:hypothetical protein
LVVRSIPGTVKFFWQGRELQICRNKNKPISNIQHTSFQDENYVAECPQRCSATSFCSESLPASGGGKIMMSVEAMKSVNPKTVDRSKLIQRSSVRLDPAAPREERLRDFIQQIKNPYCYLDGKTVVKISFSSTDTTMEDCLEHYLRGL